MVYLSYTYEFSDEPFPLKTSVPHARRTLRRLQPVDVLLNTFLERMDDRLPTRQVISSFEGK